MRGMRPRDVLVVPAGEDVRSVTRREAVVRQTRRDVALLIREEEAAPYGSARRAAHRRTFQARRRLIAALIRNSGSVGDVAERVEPWLRESRLGPEELESLAAALDDAPITTDGETT